MKSSSQSLKSCFSAKAKSSKGCLDNDLLNRNKKESHEVEVLKLVCTYLTTAMKFKTWQHTPSHRKVTAIFMVRLLNGRDVWELRLDHPYSSHRILFQILPSSIFSILCLTETGIMKELQHDSSLNSWRGRSGSPDHIEWLPLIKRPLSTQKHWQRTVKLPTINWQPSQLMISFQKLSLESWIVKLLNICLRFATQYYSGKKQ